MIIPKLNIKMNDNLTVPNFDFMSLIDGHLLINGKKVYSKIETNASGINVIWHRFHEDGKEEKGFLKLFSHGLLGNGVVLYDNEKANFTADCIVKYDTEIEGIGKWLEFDMGFKIIEGNLHVFGELEGTEDLKKSTTIRFTINQDKEKHEVLHSSIEVDAESCSWGLSEWICAEFNFTLDYTSFSGDIYKYDCTKSDNRGEKYTIKGKVKDSEFINMLKMEISNQKTINYDIEHSLKAIEDAKLLIEEVNLSVEDLFTLPAPDMNNLHELSFSKLKALMLYAIDDGWRKWFGEKKPVVGPNETLRERDIELLENEDVQTFLNDKFAVGYLTQAFSKSTDKKIQDKFKKMANVNKKLGYFWKGNTDKCFSKYKGYNIASASLMDSAYTECVSGLQKYINDNPEGWAKKLYDYCTTEVTLIGLAMQSTLDGRNRLTHLTTMLHALDPIARINTTDKKKISYATSLYERVMDVRLNKIISNFTATGEEDFVEFLTEFFKQYFNSLLAEDKWGDEVRKAGKEDLAQLMEEYKVNDVNALVSAMGNIIADAVSILRDLKDIPLPKRLNKLAEKYPKVCKSFGRALAIGVYGYSIFASVQAFMNWNELKPQEKVQAVIDTLDVCVSIFNDMVKFKAAKTLTSAEKSIEELMKASGEIKDAVSLERATEIANKIGVKLDEGFADVSSPALARGGKAAGEALAEAEELAGTASRWTKFAKVTELFARGMTVVALGAACVVTGFQIAEDFSSGQPTAILVLDILQIVADSIAFLVEAGAGLLALLSVEVCSVIPVIGIVAAVAGIVIAIVALFVHRNPPPSPEEEFIDKYSKSFIDYLDLPSEEWLEKQKKIDQHLSGGNKSLVFA
ncbi:hypothetical protein [Abyssisolibacter fermentans]|uniref:hypothetical protein n=1 Tax=Abyssisolibacter fermentans TaxID=1766203 RepID=UPI0008355763|nr:hypothetical protein [Abyssisolibacter fermentans]